MDCSFQDSLKGARYQNFISNELTLEDVDVQLASQQLSQQSKQSVLSRKEQVILELELKSNVQQFRKKLKSSQDKELEERQRLQ